MRDSYMRSGQGFMLAYAITSRVSFEQLPEFYDHILRVKDSDHVPIVLVGNKFDMDHMRQVTAITGANQATRWGVPFFETSALTRFNVEESFFELAREIKRNMSPGRGNPRRATRSFKGTNNPRKCVIL
jgi:GTPase KRas